MHVWRAQVAKLNIRDLDRIEAIYMSIQKYFANDSYPKISVTDSDNGFPTVLFNWRTGDCIIDRTPLMR